MRYGAIVLGLVWSMGGCASGAARIGPPAPGSPVDESPGASPTAEGPLPPSATPPAAGLPEIPFVDGVPSIRVTYPPMGMSRPNVRSVLVYGSVGTGSATLSINDLPVVVAPNGAFIGSVPRPSNDTLRLVARTPDWVGQLDLWYTPPGSGGGGAPPTRTIDYAASRWARVVVGGDTLATGSDVAIGRPTPTGTYRWFLPRGARVELTGERGGQARARMGEDGDAWFPAGVFAPEPGASLPIVLGTPGVESAGEWADVRLPVSGAPFEFQAMDSLLLVDVHGVTADFQRVPTGDPIVPLVEVGPSGSGGATVRIHPARRIWGFKAFYDADGSLVLRVRRPPDVDPSEPLRGIRVVVDPGHPPSGAIGPTGFVEADANLAIGLRLTEQLRARGAEVLLTRSTGADLALNSRVDTAVAWNADLLVSVHNNAFAEGANPFESNGSSTYYFHPFAYDLAAALNSEILGTTLARDLGVIRGNLALARPTWMPAVLTESLFMPIPSHESALKDPGFVERLAAAHVRGIERFLIGSMTSALTE